MNHKNLFNPDLAVLAIIIAEWENSFEDAVIVYQNPKSIDKFGNLKGRTFNSIFFEICLDKSSENYNQLKENKMISLPGRLNGVDLKLHSRIHGNVIQTSISDNTNIFKTRDEIQRAKIIDSFLMIGSHELKTPLNAIMGMSSLMLETEKDKESKEMLELIFSSSVKLDSVINKMLNFIYLKETPNSFHNKISVSVAQSIHESIPILNKYLYDRDFSSNSLILKDTKKVILPEGTIEDIILELAINLRRNTPLGKKIIFRSYNQSDSVKLEIENEGFGIPPKKLKDIFKPFILLQNKMNHSSGFEYNQAGMGMGLTIIKRCIDQIGGKIWFENKYEYMKGKENIVTLNIEFPA